VPVAFAERYAFGSGPHPHVHGANLGIRASAYLAAGGFPPLRTAEDHALLAAATRAGCMVAQASDIAVETSGRRLARAPRGFGDLLRTLPDQRGSGGNTPVRCRTALTLDRLSGSRAGEVCLPAAGRRAIRHHTPGSHLMAKRDVDPLSPAAGPGGQRVRAGRGARDRDRALHDADRDPRRPVQDFSELVEGNP
jgi:hypothetical protein